MKAHDIAHQEKLDVHGFSIRVRVFCRRCKFGVIARTYTKSLDPNLVGKIVEKLTKDFTRDVPEDCDECLLLNSVRRVLES